MSTNTDHRPDDGNGLSLTIEHSHHIVTGSDHDGYRLTRVINRTEYDRYELGTDHAAAVTTMVHLLACHWFSARSCVDTDRVYAKYLTVPPFFNGHPNDNPDDWYMLTATIHGPLTQDDRIAIYKQLEKYGAAS